MVKKQSKYKEETKKEIMRLNMAATEKELK